MKGEKDKKDLQVLEDVEMIYENRQRVSLIELSQTFSLASIFAGILLTSTFLALSFIV